MRPRAVMPFVCLFVIYVTGTIGFTFSMDVSSNDGVLKWTALLGHPDDSFLKEAHNQCEHAH
jgi:hypothetical protein